MCCYSGSGWTYNGAHVAYYLVLGNQARFLRYYQPRDIPLHDVWPRRDGKRRYGVHGINDRDALKLVAGCTGWADRIYGTGGDVHYSQSAVIPMLLLLLLLLPDENKRQASLFFLIYFSNSIITDDLRRRNAAKSRPGKALSMLIGAERSEAVSLPLILTVWCFAKGRPSVCRDNGDGGGEKRRRKKTRGKEKGDKRKPLACCKSHHLLPTCIVHMTAISSTLWRARAVNKGPINTVPFGLMWCWVGSRVSSLEG